jgi:hypothetical protein
MRHNVIFIIAVLLSWAGLLRAADDGRTDCVTALPVQMVPGGQAVLQLWLQGDDGYEADGRTYRSLQFDLVLPKGITLIENEASGEYQCSQGDLFSIGTNVSITLKEGDADANRYRFIIYNVLNTRFTAPSGSLLSLWLQADTDVPTASQLTASIEGQILGQTGDTNVHAANQPITLTTAGYVKGERARGVYAHDCSTTELYGGRRGFTVILDETEAIKADGHAYRSAQFDLHLPKGLKLRTTSAGGFAKSTTYIGYTNMTDKHEVSITLHDDETDPFYRVLVYSLTENKFGNRHTTQRDSTIFYTFFYEGDNSNSFNTGEHTIRIDNQVLGVDANKSVTADPYEFTINNNCEFTISDQRSAVTPLDNRLKFPVKVTLQTTFMANEWRAFCVPFDLSGEQLTEAFGEGVQLAQGTEAGHTLLGNSLHLQFQTCDVANGIVRGKNYLIKTTEDLDSVRLRDVLLTYDSGKTPSGINFFPAVNEQGSTVICMQANNYLRIDGEIVTYDNIGIGQLGKFDDVVFISDGQFYYTKKQAPLNAFNALFYNNAVKAALEGYTDVAYVEPQTEIDLTFEDGQTKTVSGQVVTEGDKQYVAVGKTRYEVLETLGTPLGDVNGDTTVTIADVTALVNIILGKTESPGDVADVNGDHSVTIADVTALVNIILGKTEGGTIGTGYKVRNVSPVVGYVDGEEVITWGGSADGSQE